MTNDVTLSLAEELQRLNRRRTRKRTWRRKLLARWWVFIRRQRDYYSWCVKHGITPWTEM